MMIIGNVLDHHEVAALREAAESILYEDGINTAGRYARGVKHNAQASAERDAILAKVKKALNRHEVFKSAARPRKFARMLVSRYRSGMEYGTHVDDPVMNDCRTDLSFTLLLSEPDSYEGGGLIIEDNIEARVIRLQPGDLVLYPISALHRVEPVAWGSA
ncbi:MAG: Fe2+-dependent dioxygenase [Halomonas sp.]|nr:Fe2+-dependent dioxygenase [Halomonas sp.]